MKMWIGSAALLTATLAFGQGGSGGKFSFEVASIKPSELPQDGRIISRMAADDGMLRYSNVSFKDCIRTAYRVKDFQVEGPDWLGSTRYDIVAKLPDGIKQ